MTNSTQATIRFLPLQSERTSDLISLFANVNNTIAKYLEEHPDEDEKSIRRFVAGDVCFEDLAQMADDFVIPKNNIREPSPWNKFLEGQLKKRKFSEMSQISADYEKLKDSEEFTQLQLQCKEEKNEKMQKQEVEKNLSQIRYKHYVEDVSTLLRFCDSMQRNYKTSVLLYGATDTLYSDRYGPFRYSNSASRAEKVILRDTQEKHLDNTLNDVIGVYGEKASYYRGAFAPTIASSTAESSEVAVASKGNKETTRIPWSKILGDKDFSFAVTGWPESIKKPIVDKRFKAKYLSIQDLEELTQLFKDKKMKFVPNVTDYNQQ
ncbi:hypothetical protein ABG067_007877 [Albugo candida]